MITKQVSIVPTPEECANEFANAGSNWQVRFLNALSGHAFMEDQLYHIGKDPELTEQARALMFQIGVFAPRPLGMK